MRPGGAVAGDGDVHYEQANSGSDTAAKRAFSRWVAKKRKKARREQDYERGAAFTIDVLVPALDVFRRVIRGASMLRSLAKYKRSA